MWMCFKASKSPLIGAARAPGRLVQGYGINAQVRPFGLRGLPGSMAPWMPHPCVILLLSLGSKAYCIAFTHMDDTSFRLP